MTNWDELLGRAAEGDGGVDILALKQSVDLVTIVLQHNIHLEENGERWIGHCPFHNDTNPSFAVWWDSDLGHHRCGCWSCDFGTGDVFDLVGRLQGIDFKDALAWVRTYARGSNGERPRRPETLSKEPVVDLGAFALTSRDRAAGGDLRALELLLTARDISVPARWLIEQFHVGVDDEGNVVIPHVARDGNVHAVKRRGAPDWTPRAMTGSKLVELYGVHRWVDGRKRTVVVEGESDTWTVAYALRNNDDVNVIGLPHGAGPGKPPRAEWISLLQGSEITLLFDADDAGRAGMREWASRIQLLHVARLDEARDASSVNTATLLDVIKHARPIGIDWPAGIDITAGGMIRKGNDQPIANFSLKLVRSIEVEHEEIVFEVVLPDQRHVQLSTHDLVSEASMARWINPYGYVWYGTRRDAQELMRMLMIDAIYAPKLPGVRVAGWHGESFVFPDPIGCIGTGSHVYVTPAADVGIIRRIHLDLEPWDDDAIRALLALHTRNVMTPILGWIAAAPLRARCAKFPILGVVGGSGTGKTTLVGTVLRTFGWELSTMLTATTPHAVHSLVASTNAVPVWFDEYREGARKDARLTLEQVIRDAWDGGGSMKGGLRDNLQALTYLPALAPIVVSGEDVFSETSHVERMVLVPMPSRGRNPDALARIAGGRVQVGGLGRAYLEWLVDRNVAGVLPQPPYVYDRVKHAHAVIAWGWEMLSMFTFELCGYEVGELDMSLVRTYHEDATRLPVIVEMLLEFLGKMDHRGQPLVWIQGNDLCVRVTELVQAARRETDIQLPGGSRAIRNWLFDRWDATDDRGPWGRYVKLNDAASEIVP